ncbi:proline-rich protein 36-like [Heteronotia binoei]|uniref:proline-rich protein 36-like n=1 Tax=Heteronotia binoei TaxID=13085 RepID=UPI002930F6FF|nr:proline-rich protein 36-like [Heteronotia binoei]
MPSCWHPSKGPRRGPPGATTRAPSSWSALPPLPSAASCHVCLGLSACCCWSRPPQGTWKPTGGCSRSRSPSPAACPRSSSCSAVNKMDATSPPYSGQRYAAIVGKVSAHLWRLGRNPSNVVFLPISAMQGDNMQGASREMPWFGGWEIWEDSGGTLQGMTLRQLLEAFLINHKLDFCSAGGGPQRSAEGSGDRPALPSCLRSPTGQRDRDPDCLLTGLELQPCQRIVCQAGGPAKPGAKDVAASEGYRCVVYRMGSFAMKREQPEVAGRPQPRLDMPPPLLAAPPLPPSAAEHPALLPTPEACQLVPYPSPPPPALFPSPWSPPHPLQVPLWQEGSPGLGFPTAPPGPALLLVPVTPVVVCGVPSGSAEALPWQCPEASFELEELQSPSSTGDTAPQEDESYSAAALALLLTQEVLEPDPPLPHAASPWELEEVQELPSATKEDSKPPSLPEAPQESCLGLSATTLLSSLAWLAAEEDLPAACPPGAPLQCLSPPLSADPSPQLQCLLGGSPGLPSPPRPQLPPADS